MIAVWMLGLFVALMLLRVPVDIAVGVGVLAGVLIVGHPLDVIPRQMVGSVDSFILLAVPFFVLAGNLMNAGGVTSKIFAFSRAVFGWMRGGLAQVNVVASMIFAGMSGAAIADLAGLGVVEMKAMRENGYSPRMSIAITLASCTIGPIIPPSIVLVVYGLATEVSIGRLFLAGIVPGLVIALFLMVFVNVYARLYPEEFGRLEPFIPSEVWRTFRSAFLDLLTPPIIVILLLTGTSTPTEVGVFACVYAVFLGLVNRELSIRKLKNCLVSTLGTTAIIMYLIAISTVLGEITVHEGVAQRAAEFVGGITSNRLLALLAINVFLLFVGMLLDSLPALVIASTVLFPVVRELGVDPVHFGVIICFNLIIGIITPPMGIGLYVASRVGEMPVEAVFKAVWPFFLPLLFSLLVIVAVPELSTWLPDLVFGKAR